LPSVPYLVSVPLLGQIRYHQNLAFLLGFGRYAISVFFKNASTLRVKGETGSGRGGTAGRPPGGNVVGMVSYYLLVPSKELPGSRD